MEERRSDTQDGKAKGELEGSREDRCAGDRLTQRQGTDGMDGSGRKRREIRRGVAEGFFKRQDNKSTGPVKRRPTKGVRMQKYLSMGSGQQKGLQRGDPDGAHGQRRE
mmetsp:Transcript_27252/g.53504  ORF Transcript_27252/g.53504 Transcript_27252/m.53504 type:complete len:108 (-) Transcript_27252:145-468(-)